MYVQIRIALWHVCLCKFSPRLIHVYSYHIRIHLSMLDNHIHSYDTREYPQLTEHHHCLSHKKKAASSMGGASSSSLVFTYTSIYIRIKKYFIIPTRPSSSIHCAVLQTIRPHHHHHHLPPAARYKNTHRTHTRATSSSPQQTTHTDKERERDNTLEEEKERRGVEAHGDKRASTHTTDTRKLDTFKMAARMGMKEASQEQQDAPNNDDTSSGERECHYRV